ncbi:MAG: PH domain-containing protein [Cryobacterium sp.]|nr:PH domain-containing protein [Cryobacterium sp.]
MSSVDSSGPDAERDAKDNSSPGTGREAKGSSSLTDGQWHRLHPATPLLKGGLVLLGILGVVVANLRERILHLFVPEFPGDEGDPVDFVIQNGLIGWALLGIVVVLVLLIAGSYLSWRMHTFRITGEAVEVRSGILFRTNRKARLDRIQGINIVRPMFARLFGAAKLEISQAGQDANVLLSYLGSSSADVLRAEILRLASGSRAESAAIPVGADSLIERRVNELLAPELDPNLAPPESVVKLHMGRLIGSLALSDTTIVLLLVAIAATVVIVTTGEFFVLLGIIPMIIGFGSFYIRKVSKYLRYSIANTADGIRVGYGLLSTGNETLPPGRIHSIKVNQPLLWRPAGWWEIKVNVASHSRANKGADGQGATTLLPVGNSQDVRKVLELALPDLREQSDDSRTVKLLQDSFGSVGAEGDGFTTSPRRAMVLRPFSWRRNGFGITERSVVLRKGAIWRQSVIVPQARIQSVSMKQGPLERALNLAEVQLHTVAGPISADLGAVAARDAESFFRDVSAATVQAVESDRTHRWHDSEPRAGAEPAWGSRAGSEPAPEPTK